MLLVETYRTERQILRIPPRHLSWRKSSETQKWKIRATQVKKQEQLM